MQVTPRELYESGDPWFVMFAQAVVDRVSKEYEDAKSKGG